MFDPLPTTVDGEPVETWFRRLLTGDFLPWSPNIRRSKEASTSIDAPVALDMAGARDAEPVASPHNGYGYLWWPREGGDYQALGSYGQWIYVSPEANTVAVLLSAVPRQVYMTPDQVARHGASDHTGSEARHEFVKAAIAAVSSHARTETTGGSRSHGALRPEPRSGDRRGSSPRSQALR